MEKLNLVQQIDKCEGLTPLKRKEIIGYLFELKKLGKISTDSYKKNSLIRAFAWHNTPQKHAYWSRINRILDDYKTMDVSPYDCGRGLTSCLSNPCEKVCEKKMPRKKDGTPIIAICKICGSNPSKIQESYTWKLESC